MLVERLGWSKSAAAKMLGEENWESIQTERTMEMLYEANVQQDIARMQAAVEIETQKALQAFSAQLQLQLQGAIAQMNAPQNVPQNALPAGPPAAPQLPNPGTPPGMNEAVQGEGFNPAQGGNSPLQAAPGTGTYEKQTGRTRNAA
jgi:hypothetical protein